MVHDDGRAAVGVHFEEQGLPERNTNGRCEDVPLFGLRSRHTDPFCQSAYRPPDLCRIVCYCQSRQFFLQLAAKFEIRPNARAEVSHDVTPYLHFEVWSVTVSLRLRRLGVPHGSHQDYQGDRK